MSAMRKFGGRTLARSQALQLLFQAEMLDRSVEEILAGPYALSQDDPLDEYGEELAVGADNKRDQLDAVITRASTNWPVSRMPMTDRNLLRLSLYEMLFVDEVAVAVTIDESVELAKAYGTDESSRFVNGLLGRVASEFEDGVDVIAMATLRKDAYAKATTEQQDGEAENADADADEFTPEEDAPQAMDTDTSVTATAEVDSAEADCVGQSAHAKVADAVDVAPNED